MNVIFLDIDGCCNSVHTKEFLTIPPYNFTGIDDKFIKRLAHIIKYTDAKIVLTSDWGCTNLGTMHWEYLLDKFAKFGLEIDYVIDWNRYRSREYRATAIKDWLKEHKVNKYVVIDDEYFNGYGEPEINNHLFYCFDGEDIPEKYCGITATMKNRITAYLLGCWILRDNYKDEAAMKYLKRL